MKIDSTDVKVVNINKKLSLFAEYWNPKIVGELNDHKVQVVKFSNPWVLTLAF